MNEEIRKNEITETEMENVAGGIETGICPVCGGRIIYSFNPETNMVNKPVCVNCDLKS